MPLPHRAQRRSVAGHNRKQNQNLTTKETKEKRRTRAVSSFVNLSFGRSRFLCRYERAHSHIPMLASECGPLVYPNTRKKQKRACRGPLVRNALALRSV